MVHVGIVVCIASSVPIDLPYDIAAREGCGPVDCWNSRKRVRPIFVEYIQSKKSHRKEGEMHFDGKGTHDA